MTDETTDLHQIHVERLTSDLRSTISELSALRNDPATAHFVVAEMQNISAAFTELSFLATNVGISQPPRRAPLRAVG